MTTENAADKKAHSPGNPLESLRDDEFLSWFNKGKRYDLTVDQVKALRLTNPTFAAELLELDWQPILAPTQPERENQQVWEDEKADPTDRAVSFAIEVYDNKDSEVMRAVDSARLRNINNRLLPEDDDPTYGDKLVQLLDGSIHRWVSQVCARYLGSNPERVRQEFERIITEA